MAVEKAVEQSTEELSADVRELLLSHKVWTQAVERLAREKTRLLQAVEASQREVSHGVRLRLLQIEHETAMYELCLDRVHERTERREGVENPELLHQRERFYRLMRGLAKAGNERAAMADWNSFVTCVEGEEGWSPDRWVSEMEAVAAAARKQLVAATAIS